MRLLLIIWPGPPSKGIPAAPRFIQPREPHCAAVPPQDVNPYVHPTGRPTNTIPNLTLRPCLLTMHNSLRRSTPHPCLPVPSLPHPSSALVALRPTLTSPTYSPATSPLLIIDDTAICPQLPSVRPLALQCGNPVWKSSVEIHTGVLGAFLR